MKGRSYYGWIETARKLQAISQAGLEYCHNDFDRDRYMQIRDIAYDILEHHSDYDREGISGLFQTDTGHPTPKVDVRAAIFRDDSILLIREKLDGRWALPGGWADPDITLKENLVKESMEEAGAEVIPRNILAIHDRSVRNYPPIPHGCYKIFVECEYINSHFMENTETSESGFFRLDELPELSTERNVKEQIEMCFEKKGKKNDVEFD